MQHLPTCWDVTIRQTRERLSGNAQTFPHTSIPTTIPILRNGSRRNVIPIRTAACPPCLRQPSCKMANMSYAIPVRTAARWAPRWRTPHIYILRLVPRLTGAQTLESRVMSYWGPCPTNVRLSYPSSRRTAHLTCKVIPILTKAERGGGGAQNGAGNDRQCQGLLPPFFGSSNLHLLFLNFGPGGIAPVLAIGNPLLLSTQFSQHTFTFAYFFRS